MKSKYIISIIAYFILPLPMIGQPQDRLELEPMEEMAKKVADASFKLTQISSPLDISKKQLKGVYLDQNWSSAVVYSKSKEFIHTVARYNIHKRRMEIEIDNTLRTLQINNINGIILADELFIPLSSGEKEDGDNLNFYKVLSIGELTLLIKNKLTLHTIGSSPMHTNIGTNKEYKSSEQLYYCKKGEKPLKLKKGKKNVLELFGSNRDLLEKIANENNFGYRKESDLISLFDLHNEQMK